MHHIKNSVVSVRGPFWYIGCLFPGIGIPIIYYIQMVFEVLIVTVSYHDKVSYCISAIHALFTYSLMYIIQIYCFKWFKSSANQSWHCYAAGVLCCLIIMQCTYFIWWEKKSGLTCGGPGQAWGCWAGWYIHHSVCRGWEGGGMGKGGGCTAYCWRLLLHVVSF